MAKWIPVAPEKEFTEKVRVITHDGVDIAVFRLEDGFYAIDDECSHAYASLSEGDIFDHIVECPRHGAQFDIKTGQNLSLPATAPVKSYPVKVEDGVVYVQVKED